jgi:hypothetical protein
MGKTVFIDLFLLLLLNILLMFFMAILIMGSRESVKTPELQNCYLVTYTWPTEDNSDVDGWIRRNLDPETLCFFRRREVDVFTLHNDNTGAVYGMVDGKKLNQAIETITINSSDRNFYELSLHGYRIPKSKGKTMVNVKVERVNPYSVIFNNDVEVYNAEETKVCSFQIDDKGNLEEVNGNPELLNNLVTDIPNRL